jgi:hypothetical protein
MIIIPIINPKRLLDFLLYGYCGAAEEYRGGIVLLGNSSANILSD